MLNKILFPGKYIQGVGALAELPSQVKRFGRQGLILASPTPYQEILPAERHRSGRTLFARRTIHRRVL